MLTQEKKMVPVELTSLEECQSRSSDKLTLGDGLKREYRVKYVDETGKVITKIVDGISPNQITKAGGEHAC